MGIFLADLRVVFAEPHFVRSENSKVDVHDDLLIELCGQRSMTRGQHKPMNAGDRGVIYAGAGQDFAGKVSATSLVVLGVKVVDRVMEPDGHLDLSRAAGKRTDRIEEGDAFKQVLDSVIAPVALAIAEEEPITDVGTFTMATQFSPGATPRRFEHRLKAV